MHVVATNQTSLASCAARHLTVSLQTLSTVQTVSDTSQRSTITGQADRAHATLTACSTLSQNKTRPRDKDTVHKVIQRAPASREAAMQQEKKKQTQHILTLTLSKRRTVERASRGSGRLSSHTRDLVLIRLGPIRLVDVTETTCVPAAAAAFYDLTTSGSSSFIVAVNCSRPSFLKCSSQVMPAWS